MSFIDNRMAQEISKWEKKYPKEAEAYFREHQEISHLFINNIIPYDDFKARSYNLKEKYHYLEDSPVNHEEAKQ
jgi:hypothetical protein